MPRRRITAIPMTAMTASVARFAVSGSMITRAPRRSCLQRPRLVGEHDRDAVADGVGELGGTADQLLALGVVFERRLGERADQDLEELRIDDAGRPDRIVHPFRLRYCKDRPLPPPGSPASDISVIATSVSARLLRSGASRRA